MKLPFELENSDIHPSEKDLVAFEHWLGYPLPDDYRGFQLSTNGGLFRPPDYDKFYFLILPDPETGEVGDVQVAEFFGILGDEYGSNLSVIVKTVRENHGFPAQFLPIACSGFGDWIVLSLLPSEYYGSVCFIYHDKPDPGGSNLTYLAPSFADFISRLVIRSDLV